MSWRAASACICAARAYSECMSSCAFPLGRVLAPGRLVRSLIGPHTAGTDVGRNKASHVHQREERPRTCGGANCSVKGLERVGAWAVTVLLMRSGENLYSQNPLCNPRRNFEKVLVDRQGRVVGRYASTTSPESIAGDIEKALG